MTEFKGSRRAAGLVCFFLAAAPRLLQAVDTHIWEQSDQADFARGTTKNLSIRSDGRLTLAPQFKELDSTTVPYLWAVAQDSKGTLYYAGGAPTGASTKIYSWKPGSPDKPRTFAEINSLEVHALAVDGQDRLYAAVLPEAKIYRMDSSGKAQVFFDAKCKYIWALAFDKAGNLFVATGDSGLIYKVAPDGTGTKFFDTEETHARSMVLDGEGNLIVGTEPSGLVLRITPQGKGFVLYQSPKREVTAVAERDGTVYAAAVGNKSGSGLAVSAVPAAPPPPAQTAANAPKSPAPPAPVALPPPINSLTPAVNGGSELYRIEKDGFPERIWASTSDVVYALTFDTAGHPILGTGNKGMIFRLDSPQLTTTLLNTPPTQVLSFLQGRDGILYATTGNVGNLYAIGPAIEPTGNIESDVLDANEFAVWGKAHVTDVLRGGAVELETRSGNVSHPGANWTSWAKVDVNELGGQIHSPPARFLQYRLTLRRAGGDAASSPEVSLVDLAYLPKNAAPKLLQIEMAPFNYRQAPSNQSLERSVQASGSPNSITLPAVGQKRAGSAGGGDAAAGATLQYAKGAETVRWSANDPNGDLLFYTVEIKGVDETVWRLLKEKLLDKYFAFDTAAFADGRYQIRITASDAPGNIASQTLTSSLVSDSFVIDNTPPVITFGSPAGDATHRTIPMSAKDALSWLDKAEYSIDGGEWQLLLPDNAVTDSQALSYTVKVDAGHLLAVRIYDENDNVAVKQLQVK